MGYLLTILIGIGCVLIEQTSVIDRVHNNERIVVVLLFGVITPIFHIKERSAVFSVNKLLEPFGSLIVLCCVVHVVFDDSCDKVCFFGVVNSVKTQDFLTVLSEIRVVGNNISNFLNSILKYSAVLSAVCAVEPCYKRESVSINSMPNHLASCRFVY